MLNRSLTVNKNDQHLLIAAFMAPAYIAWVLYEPTLGRCTTMPAVYATIRIGLVLGWLAYIVIVKAREGSFSWDYFSFGMISGGLALMLLFVFLGLLMPYQENAYHPIKQYFEPLVHMAPTATISGLYASFSASRQAAIRAGFLCLILQFVFSTMMTLLISCTY